MSSLTDRTRARNRIESDLIDILITDVEMPGVNGLSLLRCAKRRNAITQVIFITGHSSLDAFNDALELGVTDYLLKPLVLAELVEVLGQAQERVRRWRRALAGTTSLCNSPSPAGLCASAGLGACHAAAQAP